MTSDRLALAVHDVRFPTSRGAHGSDAMNPDPDYSAAYAVLGADGDALQGHGFVFTIGRGNEVAVAAIQALAPLIAGTTVEDALSDLGSFSRRLVYDSQLRWLGPEKGVMHMAIGAVVNAAWDLRAKRAGLPLWRLLGEMSPDELVDVIDFRYLSDALTPEDARGMLQDRLAGRASRIEALLSDGYPAYTTTPGWLGYDDSRLATLSRAAVADGFDMIKLKVGADLGDDVRRLRVAREAVGDSCRIAIDANQRWDVAEAIRWVRALSEFDPWWIEEPTSPDEILGLAAIRKAVRPTRVATGEHTQNRVVFKQLLQAGAVDIVQLDATRVAGVNENLAILLLAARYGVPVCPHAGGVGLCELVQHLAMTDVVAVSGRMDDRAIEYVDHLHEHFVDPVRIRRGRYLAPEAAGSSAQMWDASLAAHTFPTGAVWAGDAALPVAPPPSA